MKSLLLLRHAKSSRDDPALEDFDRPLAKRGRNAAPAIGAELASRGWLPEAVLVSPAKRTRQTWALVAAELPAAPKAMFAKPLYMASPEQLLQRIQKVAATKQTLLVVGHNPGMEELALQLAGSGSDPNALAGISEKFPTAALARFAFDGQWADLSTGKAKLTHFLRPRDLE
ncbi:phosphohistidine phosphatase [Mesorhizobium albiziae]|uniref:Phosphohistidine phosphatase n=1 Tax=Neomesorhizobium albiziae TaxID=335020 RepID=A0A1I4DCU5_9HYPH|nr:histidine phosphatase family protein [Mesorhizobium albiziae]GLS32350.1 phosphoglycerate mutase [Mesorhizobium albiziae]SFK91312.1 phosphohistidine phosphatase [Mesorhizobium albiziae]